MDSKPYNYQPSYVQQVPTPGINRPPTIYKRNSFFSPHGWLLECVTAIMSIVFFAGIAAVLYYMNGRPLSDWTPPIALNAVISILSTACGTALMHGVGEGISQHKWLYFRTGPQQLDAFKKIDQASRGTSGSAKLILGAKWNLATIGAVISIARLAFSPLIQQVIQIDQRLVTLPATASEVTYGYTHKYDRPDLDVGVGFIGAVPQDAQMQSAILQGLFNISTPATFSCPGTCSWTESTVSLGFKADCVDVTQETLDTQSCNTEQNGRGANEERCVMKTPNDVTLMARSVSTSFATTYATNVSEAELRHSSDLPEKWPVFIDLATYRTNVDANFVPETPEIVQCSISFAAYEYVSARANGSDFAFTEQREVDIKDVKWESKTDLNTWFHSEPSQDKGLPEFVISGNDLSALQLYFRSSSIVSEWLDGSVSVDDNKDLGISAALKGDTDIAERFAAMATSMTNYLRTGPNEELQVGSKDENVAFVIVRWYWLAGPAAIEVGAVLFVLIVIFSNRKSRRVPLWKSSITAVLNTTIDEPNAMLRPRELDIRALEKRNEKIVVRLE